MTFTEPEEIVGNQEVFVGVDFTKVEDSDSKGDSHYVVGGRTYFEANAIGENLQSFTTKGFFDKAGYVEPIGTKQKSERLAIILSVSAAVLIVIIVVIVCLCKRKKIKND